MITHNEVTVFWWLVVAASSGTVGLLLGRWKPPRQRLEDEYEYGYDRGWDDHETQRAGLERLRAAAERGREMRRTVVLEPGPTIYPALSPDALGGAESHGEATERLPRIETGDLWLETVLVSWETRYPIQAGT